MNLTRTILDGIVLCIIFNAIVGLFFFVTPQGYSVMFPKGIREAAKPYVTRKDRRIMHWAIYPLMILYMALSAHLAGVEGFWHFFWTGYIEMMFVNAGDFLLLDVLGRMYVMDKGLIKGAEDHPDWKLHGWWKLAVPEHGLA